MYSVFGRFGRSSDKLHGVISFQLDATPICGFTQSSSLIPTARSMPRDPVASRPSVTTRDRGLMSTPFPALGSIPSARGLSGVMRRSIVLIASRVTVVDRLPRELVVTSCRQADQQDANYQSKICHQLL